MISTQQVFIEMCSNRGTYSVFCPSKSIKQDTHLFLAFIPHFSYEYLSVLLWISDHVYGHMYSSFLSPTPSSHTFYYIVFICPAETWEDTYGPPSGHIYMTDIGVGQGFHFSQCLPCIGQYMWHRGKMLALMEQMGCEYKLQKSRCVEYWWVGEKERKVHTDRL